MKLRTLTNRLRPALAFAAASVFPAVSFAGDTVDLNGNDLVAEALLEDSQIGPIGGAPSIAPELIGSLDLAPWAPEDSEEVEDLNGDSQLSPSPAMEIVFPESLLHSSSEPVESKAAVAPSPTVARIATAPDAPSAKSPARPDWMTPLSPSEIQLRNQVRNVQKAYSTWRLNTRDHSPWEILHLIIAHGTESQVLVDGPQGKPATAIGWLCYNNRFRNLELMYSTPQGLQTRQGPGLEGHHGQFLGMLAQARVMRDYPIRVGGREYSVDDLIEYEKRTCYPGTELTFKLIGLGHYLEPTATWTNDRGESWDIERLVREEMKQPIRGAACGGTHRLESLAMALRKRSESELPIDGDFAAAAQRVREFQIYTLRLQNRDGSFSTNWFQGPGSDPDTGRRMRTTGHQLEWLVISLPDQELRRPEVQRAVEYLTNLLWRSRHQTWDAGKLGHSLNALNLYNAKVFDRIDAFDRAESVAAR